MSSPSGRDGALSRGRAYLKNAAHIAWIMGRYAASREPHGLRNGLRAANRLAHEIAGQLKGAAPRCFCPICGWSGERFGPMYYVDEYRDDVRCYGCGATDRARLAKLYVGLLFAELFTSGARRPRVLDVGPDVFSRSFFPPDVDYVSFDLVAPHADVRGDLCAAPFPDAHYDMWLCFHVLDYIADDEQAMRELFRVLRPGGIGLLDHVMNWNAETEEYGGSRPRESHHRRRYGVDLPGRLRAIGFQVEVATTEDLLDAETRERHGVHHRRIVVCRRPAAPAPSDKGDARTER